MRSRVRAPRIAADGMGLALVGHHAVLAARALRRRPWLALLVWLAVMGLTVGALAVVPRTYDAETTMQVEPVSVIRALSGSATQREPDAPGPSAAETVLRRENLVALVAQTDLVERWKANRAPLSRLKDALWARLFRPPTREEQVDGFVGLLEKRLWVDVTKTTVGIGVHFPDPELAFRLVDAAQQNFLEARRVSELSTIEDAISILENHATSAKEDVDEALRGLEESRGVRAGRLPGAPLRLLEPPRRRTGNAGSDDLVVQLQTKRRGIEDLDEARRRRITELETRLEEQRALYSDGHPVVQDLRQSLESLRQPSPQIASLRADVTRLESELRTRGLLSEVPVRTARSRDPSLSAAVLESVEPGEDTDPKVVYAKARAKDALARYVSLVDRLDAAKLELDSARAAFKYRYAVVRPPTRPRRAARPDAPVVLGAAALAGLLLALLAPAFAELASGRFSEGWQVRHALGVPLLGELDGR